MEYFKQLEAKKIGDSGCYFLSIIHSVTSYAKENLHKTIKADIINLYEIFTKEKWMDQDCFIERPDLCAAYLLGVDVTVLRSAFNQNREIRQVKIAKEDLSYTPYDNQIEITRYELKDTGVTYGHFVETRNNNVVYDPYGKSRTVTKGTPISKRIFTINM